MTHRPDRASPSHWGAPRRSWRAWAWWLAGLAVACGGVDRRLDPGPLEVTAPVPPRTVSAEARGWALKARVAEERGALDEAERALGWVLRLERDEPASWVLWGRYLERQHRSQEAAEAYEEALARDPDWGPAHLYLGDLYVRAGRDAEAVRHLSRAIALDRPIEAFEVLARLYERMDATTELEALVLTWMEVPLSRADDRLLRAQAALHADLADRAVDDLVVVLEDRDEPLVAELLVEAGQRGCRVGTAYRAAVRLGLPDDPAYATAWERLALRASDPAVLPRTEARILVLANRLIALGRPDEAVELLGRARLHGHSDALWLAQALALAADGHVGPALEATRKVRSTAVAPQVDTRFTDATEAPLDVQARELRGHLRLDADEAVPEDEQLPSVQARQAVRQGAAPATDLTDVLRTRLLIDAGRPEEAAAAATSADARIEAARALPDRFEPHGCDGVALMAKAAVMDGCASLDYLDRAWEAEPRLSGLDVALSEARLACDTQPSTEPR